MRRLTLVLLILAGVLAGRGLAQEDRQGAATSLSAEQKAQVRAILSRYDASSLTTQDARAINDAFRSAGLRNILVWQEGGEWVGLIMAVGLIAMLLFARWLVRRKKQGKPVLIDPQLFSSKYFRLGVSGQMLQNIALGGTMIALPIYFQMVFEYTAMQTGLALAPFSLSIFAVALLAGRRAGKRRPSRLIQAGFGILSLRIAILIAFIPRADSGLIFAIPLAITGIGIGLLVSQLNNYTLSPISEERVSEAA